MGHVLVALGDGLKYNNTGNGEQWTRGLRKREWPMKVADRVYVAPPMLASWYTLPGAVKEQLVETLVALANRPPEQWPTTQARRLNSPEPYYMLRADDGLLVFLRREGDGQLTILDLVLQEMIERYFAKKPEPAQAI